MAVVQIISKNVRAEREFQVERVWTARGWRTRYRFDGKIVSKGDYGKLLLMTI